MAVIVLDKSVDRTSIGARSNHFFSLANFPPDRLPEMTERSRRATKTPGGLHIHLLLQKQPWIIFLFENEIHLCLQTFNM